MRLSARRVPCRDQVVFRMLPFGHPWVATAWCRQTEGIRISSNRWSVDVQRAAQPNHHRKRSARVASSNACTLRRILSVYRKRLAALCFKLLAAIANC